MKSLFNKSLATGIFLLSCLAQAANPTEDEMITRGRYIVKVTGCNDCHTPNYGERNGQVPENEWLIGTPIGYKGPWGTTYAKNLRRLLANKTETEWVTYAKKMQAKPPMPWYNVNALSEEDLKAIYQFIHYLGDNPNKVPKELPPGETPKTPYINFEVILPTN
jgi:mono/diheme cytochrome c family protein